jgi:hypothetical protein
MIFAGETEVLGENLPSATLSTINPIWIDPGANPGLRGERPATNRLSHGTALNSFNYLGNLISYENEMHIGNKLNNYLKITGTTNNVFRRKKTLNKTRIKLYNTLALPPLLYGSENWTIKAKDATKITAAEMKYMRRTAGYTWTDHKTNIDIAKELNITPVLDKIQDYKRKWIQHVNRMPHNNYPD